MMIAVFGMGGTTSAASVGLVAAQSEAGYLIGKVRTS